MFGSVVLDVAIGLSLVFLVLSIFCSAAKEVIATVVGLRASTLEEGVRNLLQDPAKEAAFYDHPIIRALAPNRATGKPTNIPGTVFAQVLLDVLRPAGGAFTEAEVVAAAGGEGSALRVSARAVLSGVGADVEKARRNVEAWFDHSMERVTELYRGKTRMIVFTVALASSSLLNVDSIAIANTLWHQPEIRASVVAAAEQAVRDGVPGNGEKDPFKRAGVLQSTLMNLGLPTGWTKSLWEETTATCGALRTKVLGLLISALAATAGAPFWFDVMKKFTGVRTATKKE